MSYNLTIIGNQTGVVPLLQKVNSDLMFGQFGNLALLAMGIILFMAFMGKLNDPKKAVAGSMFIVFVSAIFFRAMELTGNGTIFITLILAGLSAAALYVGK